MDHFYVEVNGDGSSACVKLTPSNRASACVAALVAAAARAADALGEQTAKLAPPGRARRRRAAC